MMLAATHVCLSLIAAMAMPNSPKKPSFEYLLKDAHIEHSNGAVTSHVRIFGNGNAGNESVVLVPSLGRGVEDFTEQYRCTITAHLVEAGYDVVLIQPRGIGKSAGDLTPQYVTMPDLVNDLLRTLDELKIGKAHFFGHAFGNRLCRTLAATHPDRVMKLGVFASGGNFAMTAEQTESLRGSLDLSLSDDARLVHIRRAFFAHGNDPAIWLNGWYPPLAAAQIAASRGIDPELYKKAGGKPFLLIQATEDFVAPPDKAGKALKEQLGDQVTYVEIEHAGHAMTAEQPDRIAEIVVKYLKGN